MYFIQRNKNRTIKANKIAKIKAGSDPIVFNKIAVIRMKITVKTYNGGDSKNIVEPNKPGIGNIYEIAIIEFINEKVWKISRGIVFVIIASKI